MLEIKDYTKDSLKIIENSDFLVSDDWKAISEMKDELQDTFEKKQIWRTETEMRVSVLQDIKFKTKASKYWQCVREQSVFFENLVSLSFEYRRNLIEIKKLEKKISLEKDELEVALLVIELEERNFGKKNMETQSKDRVRELREWSKIKKELDDGSFDTENVNSHQLISYTTRFVNQIVQAGGSGSFSEKINLEGQLLTSLRHCAENGVMDAVRKELTDPGKDLVDQIETKLKLLK